MPTGIAGINFDDRGLVPCVMQDWRSGEVLTLAYMNEEALRRTQETGEVHFYSRKRGEIWHKGGTSGNVQRVKQLRYDCDGDAIVALVEPAGPACHTGERSCFYREVGGRAETLVDSPPYPGEPVPATHEAMAELERTMLARRRDRPERSYTVQLLDDPKFAADKVREESAEVIKAVEGESEERIAEEAADVIYHMAALMLSRGVSMAEALNVLNGRRA
jgi:phosphoribosyl-AMP cyclohydrolase / phosphoribosyl-ATP pyrophosphohydrolase